MKFTQLLSTTQEHLDEQGHVNNVVYVRWVQDVAVAHWLDVTSKSLQDQVSWFMLRHEIDYKKQAFDGEQIVATTWVGAWTAVTCERFVDIHRGSDLLASSRTVWCMLDRQTAKPKRITQEIKDLFRSDDELVRLSTRKAG